MDNATSKYVSGVAHAPGNGQFPTSRHVQMDFQTSGTPLPPLRQTVVNTGNRLRRGG